MYSSRSAVMFFFSLFCLLPTGFVRLSHKRQRLIYWRSEGIVLHLFPNSGMDAVKVAGTRGKGFGAQEISEIHA